MEKEPKDLQDMVIDYTIHLKRRVEAGTLSANTLPTMIFGVKAFMDANNIDLKWNKIFKYFPESVKRTGAGQWTTEQIKMMLEADNIDRRDKALILFLASSGVRIGALTDLKIKHLVLFESCYCVTVYANTKDEYFTFITPEAKDALDSYIEQRKTNGEPLTENSAVFRTDYNNAPRSLSKAALQSIINRILHRAKLRQKGIGKYQRYETQIDTGFRKHFNTVFIDLNLNPYHKERLMGHAVTIQLDNNYHVPDKQKLFATYQKAIPHLTIDQTEKQKILLEQKQAQITELQVKNKEIASLRKELDHIVRFLKANPQFCKMATEYFVKNPS
jgi:integrase